MSELTLEEQVGLLSRLVQQMNDRLITMERTVNTMLGGAIPASDPYADINRQPPPQQGKQVEVKHMMNADGSQIFRFPMSDKSWIVIRTDYIGDIIGTFRDFANGDRGEVDLRDAQELLDTITLYNRPPQREPSLFPDGEM